MSAVDNETEEEVWRRRLRRVVGDRGGPSAVARLAEIPLQTLKNALNGRTKKPPMAILQRVAGTCGVSFTWLAGESEEATPVEIERSQMGPDAAAEEEIEPIELFTAAGLKDLFWRVKTAVLDLEHVLPGDVIQFSAKARPRKDDFVLAEVRAGDTVRRIVRLYEPPFLVTRSSDPAISKAPLEVDGERVRIAGVFIELRRLKGNWR